MYNHILIFQYGELAHNMNKLHIFDVHYEQVVYNMNKLHI